MKNGLLKSLLVGLLGTLTIYGIQRMSLNESKIINIFNYSIRSLSTEREKSEEIKKEICDKARENFLEFYQKEGPDYSYNAKKENKIIVEMIERYAKTKDLFNSDLIKDYLFQNGRFIFFFSLLVLVILMWIPYIICVCCRTCLCIPKKCSDLSKINLIITIFITVIILIVCIVGFTQENSIIHGIFGIGCGILKLKDHLFYGDDYKIKPYWIGLSTIIDSFNGTLNFINDLPQKTNKINEQLTSLNTPIQNFKKNLSNEYKTKNNYKVSNPIPYEDNYSPEYLNKYGPVENEETSLGSIYVEFSGFANNSISILDNIISTINLSSDDRNETTFQLESLKNFMNDSIYTIDDSLIQIVNDYRGYSEKSESLFIILMSIFFALNLLAAIGILCSLFGLVFIGLGKFTLLISWFVIYILMILSIILSIVFGASSTLLQDATFGISYLSNNPQSISFIESQEIKDLVDTCMNGDGIISNISSLGFTNISFENEIIDNIYSLEGDINQAIKNLSSYELISIKATAKEYDIIEKDLKSYCPKLSEALSNIRKYIDYSIEETLVSSDTIIYDDWEIRKSDCPKNYQYLEPKNSIRNLKEENSKYCLVVEEWELDDIINRYNQVKIKESDETSAVQAESYFTSITEFLKNNNELLENLKDKNNEFKEDFRSIINDEKNVLSNIKTTIQPIRNIFEDIVGNNSIFKMLTCKFLKRDLNKILDEMSNSLGDKLGTIGIIFFIIAFSEFILTLFILIFMSRYEEPVIIEDNTKSALAMEMSMRDDSSECVKV